VDQRRVHAEVGALMHVEQISLGQHNAIPDIDIQYHETMSRTISAAYAQS
jgi:hypothetical protein